MDVRVELLGQARVVLADGTAAALRPTMRDQALAYLALSGDWILRDRLGFLFWPDVPDDVARHNVRQLLKRIRRLRWVEGLRADGDSIRWEVTTDVALMHRAVDEERWDDLPSRGELLPGFERRAPIEYEEWLLAERRRIRHQWRSAVLTAAAASSDAGRPVDGAELLEPLLHGADGHHLLLPYMELMAKAARPRAAIAAFDRVAARMRDEHGLEAPVDARNLVERLRSAPPSQVDAPTQTSVGRQQDVADVAALLARPDCRLVTLLGPGGIGKSTLARLLVTSLSPRYTDGAWLVSLEAVPDPDGVPAAIATALSLTLDGRLDPVEQLASHLHRRQLLVALDNMEHLTDAGVIASELLEQCRQLHVLVTSRERLRLDAEWVFDVSGLADDDAIELLQRHARRIAPDAVVERDDAQAVCWAVGGSPLGIELAAPWLRVMPCRQVADEIENDATVLAGGRRDAPGRHRSLQATMARSWELATDEERDAVEALSVFAGPYTNDLATAVAEASPMVLRDLSDKSLVQRRADGRYASHPLVRQYAAARLASDEPRRRSLRHRHAEAILDLVQRSETVHEQLSILEDAVAAWHHGVEHGDVDLVAGAADRVVQLVEAAGRYTLGLTLVQRASSQLRGPGSGSMLIATLLHGESLLLYRLGRHEESAQSAEQALVEASSHGHRRLTVRARLALGWARKWAEGDTAQYATILEALPEAEDLDDDALVAMVLNGLGCSAPTLKQCRDHLLDGLARLPGQRASIRLHLLCNLGIVSWAVGDITTAVARLDAAIALARSMEQRPLLAFAQAQLAFVRAQSGDISTAQRLSDEAISMSSGLEDSDVSIYIRIVDGEIRRLVGDTGTARRRAQEALGAAHAVGNDAFTLRALRLDGQLLVDAGSIDEGLRELAFVLAHTDRRGDFTCEILNPQVWETATAAVSRARADDARDVAAVLHLDTVARIAIERAQ